MNVVISLQMAPQVKSLRFIHTSVCVSMSITCVITITTTTVFTQVRMTSRVKKVSFRIILLKMFPHGASKGKSDEYFRSSV